MWTAEVVLLCALNMLGRSPSSLPPIELVSTLPPGASPGVEAYVLPGDPHIYLVTTSANFLDARAARVRCGDTMVIRKIASVLIHEEAHLRQGADEKTAYEVQLMTLMALGAGVGSPPYMQVARALRHTLKQQRYARRPDGLMASAQP